MGSELRTSQTESCALTNSTNLPTLSVIADKERVNKVFVEVTANRTAFFIILSRGLSLSLENHPAKL